MALVNILMMSVKLKIVMLRKPTGFRKILRDVIIFSHFLYDEEDL